MSLWPNMENVDFYDFVTFVINFVGEQFLFWNSFHNFLSHSKNMTLSGHSDYFEVEHLRKSRQFLFYSSLVCCILNIVCDGCKCIRTWHIEVCELSCSIRSERSCKWSYFLLQGIVLFISFQINCCCADVFIAMKSQMCAAVTTSLVALCWMCDSPCTGCAWRTTIYTCGANKQ